MTERKVPPMEERTSETPSDEPELERARERVLERHRKRLPQLDREFRESRQRVERLRRRRGWGSEAG